MSTVATKTLFTPEDLLTMPDGDLYELVNGNLVERKMGARASFVAGHVHGLLWTFNRTHPQGWAFPEGTSYQCFPHSPNQVRKPDVSFIRLGRLTGEDLPEGHIPIPPDLAVEVISPNDLAYEIDQKVEEYLRAGVRLVWVINPETRTAWVYHADGTGSLQRENDELSGEDILPGFRCLVRDLFPPPLTPAPATS